MKTAIAFFIFKRPEHTTRVWSEIRRARPPVLFLVADGPRNEAERVECDSARRIVENVDWPCDVRRNYADTNMGCKHRVSSGLNWVFDQVEEAIILEDDCVPVPSFFAFCEELLAHYRLDERVMHISGDNYLKTKETLQASYYFSKYAHVWGWATWRRAWRKFDLSMKAWPSFRSSEQLMRICQDQSELLMWQDILDGVYSGETVSWAYIWQYCCFINGGLSAVPIKNLVSNIGTGTDATHRNDDAWYMNLPAADLPEIVHEICVIRNAVADAAVFERVYKKPQLKWHKKMVRALVSPWTYGRILRKIPIIGPAWGVWRKRLGERRHGLNARNTTPEGYSCPPVLLLLFNRPRLTQKVFDRIREAKPAILFIAADGPRSNRSDDVALCEETRAIVEVIDWPCQVHRLYSESNLGCKKAVISGITWAFEHVEQAIILEDDCLPHLTYFRFASEMLARYKDEPRVMHISGTSVARRLSPFNPSYYFTRYSFVWGWATWRRAWRLYDAEMTDWQVLRGKGWLQGLFGVREHADFWETRLETVMHQEVFHTWDYQWMFACWVHGSANICPGVNLVTNIGFGAEATHTVDGGHKLSELRSLPMIFPLRHPAKITFSKRIEDHIFRTCYSNLPTGVPGVLLRLRNRYFWGKLLRSIPVIGKLWGAWRKKRAIA